MDRVQKSRARSGRSPQNLHRRKKADTKADRYSKKMSDNWHFSRRMICSSLPSVMLCSPLSKRCSVEGGIPSFRENSAKVCSPRCLRRKIPSCRSRESRTRRGCKILHSVCGISLLTVIRRIATARPVLSTLNFEFRRHLPLRRSRYAHRLGA